MLVTKVIDLNAPLTPEQLERLKILERLENLPTKIYRTDRDGLIKFKTDGKTLSVETFNR